MRKIVLITLLLSATGCVYAMTPMDTRALQVAVDRKGFAYTKVWDKIYKVRSSGQIVAHWNSHYPTSLAWGLAVSPKGYVYVSDSYGTVNMFSTTGRFIAHWSSSYDMIDLATDKEGRVYGQARSGVISITGSKGEFKALIYPWSSKSSERYWTGYGVTVDEYGNVYGLYEIPTYGHKHNAIMKTAWIVVKIDSSGKIVKFWGDKGSNKTKLDNAKAIAIGPNNVLCVLERDRVVRYSSSGKYLSSFGLENTLAYGIAIGPSRNIYVVSVDQAGGNRLRIYNNTGKLIRLIRLPN